MMHHPKTDVQEGFQNSTPPSQTSSSACYIFPLMSVADHSLLVASPHYGVHRVSKFVVLHKSWLPKYWESAWLRPSSAWSWTSAMEMVSKHFLFHIHSMPKSMTAGQRCFYTSLLVATTWSWSKNLPEKYLEFFAMSWKEFILGVCRFCTLRLDLHLDEKQLFALEKEYYLRSQNQRQCHKFHRFSYSVNFLLRAL